MTTHEILIQDNITFLIHNCDLSLELSEILITAIKTLPNSPEFQKPEIKHILEFLKNINIYISNENNKQAACYRDNNIMFFTNQILKELETINKVEINSIIQQTIIHECTHEFQDKKTKYIQRFQQRRKKFKKKLQPSLFGKIFPFNFDNYKREEIFDFVNSIFLEGLAMYLENIEKNIDTYELQKQCEKIIIKIKNNYLDVEKIEKIETNELDKYRIGLLMTLIILNNIKLNISFETLSNVGFKQFIEYYEKAAQNQRYKVLISYSSNTGILDYQSLIKFWKIQKREKKKNKNNK
jgi:predicted Zn-dependent protease with MMP-like domain